METVVLVMMMLVCFNYLLKQTYRKTYFIVLSAAICALFTGFMWKYAIEQSKSQISHWLADSALMLDLSVLLTLEVAIQMAFCVIATQIQTSGKIKPYMVWGYRILRWFPGTLIFPVLFALLVVSIFSLPGVSFPLIAWSLSAIIFILIPLGIWGIKRILPEKELRLEILFLSNALIAILGVVATVNGRTAVSGTSYINWSALLGIVALAILGLIGGIIEYKFRLKRIIKKQ